MIRGALYDTVGKRENKIPIHFLRTQKISEDLPARNFLIVLTKGTHIFMLSRNTNCFCQKKLLQIKKFLANYNSGIIY